VKKKKKKKTKYAHICLQYNQSVPQASLSLRSASRSHFIMSTDVHLRPASHSDWHQVVALLERCRLPAADVVTIIENFELARCDDRIVGCAAAEQHGESILVRSVAVEPAYRDRGIASRMVAALLIRARGTNVRDAYLLSASAPAYFARWGFALIPAENAPAEVKASAAFQRAIQTAALCMRCELR
jgi:amino-acid N-acetyltransferase